MSATPAAARGSTVILKDVKVAADGTDSVVEAALVIKTGRWL